MEDWQRSRFERKEIQRLNQEFFWTVGFSVAPVLIIWVSLFLFTDGEASWLDVVRRGELYLVALVIAGSALRGVWAARSGPLFAVLVVAIAIMVIIWSDILINTVVDPDPNRVQALAARAEAGVWWVLGTVLVGSLVDTSVSRFGRWRC